jgi:AraC-like DNA-binding protein
MENKTLFSISIEELLEGEIGVGLGNDIIASSQLTEYIDLLGFPLRVDALVFFVCTKGNINATINLTEWNVTPNTYVASLPENVIGLNSVSDDFEGYVILFSMDYLRKISIDLKDVLPYYTYIRNNPCFNVPPSNVAKITRFYDLLYSSLTDEKSNRQDDVIRGLVISIISKISDDLDVFGLQGTSVKTKSKEYYFLKFMDLLLLHFRAEHNVGFYAGRLAITPKYLSSLIRDISGLSAPQWINDYIVVEAKTLLKSSDMNIKQIAEYLYFPNPSFFSKYFKQHTGVSPKEYRGG